MNSLAVATVVAKNYLSFARVLADSFLARHPGVPFYVLLADEVEGSFDPACEPFRLLTLADLAIPQPERFRFRYSRRQVAVASKPYLLEHLLDRGFASALYLDPDMLVMGDLSPMIEQALRHPAIVTPHLIAPASGHGGVGRELNILQCGTFNGGVLGFSDTPAARRFLGWWRERLYGECRYEITQGLYYDQRWLDLLPAFVDGAKVVRDPGCNIAYWNLMEREVRIDGDAVLVNGRPARFFHFSGFDPLRPDRVTKYRPELATADLGPAARIYEHYAALINGAGYTQIVAWPYRYGTFDNGVPIPEIARQFYDSLADDAAGFGDPFQTEPPGSFFRWLNEPVPFDGTRLWRFIHESRPDLEAIHGAAFLEWAVRHGAAEFGIPDALLP
ncbi:MAG TPA: hypothetical protein VN442_21100 [Bryobacteraceae bacterium]|nr:hypothetical protein [Bryobacteraceae bacterium]